MPTRPQTRVAARPAAADAPALVPVARALAASVACLVAVAAACARPAAPRTVPTPVEAAGLPPVPRVTGPLAIRVVSPGAGESVGPRDSTFVFGAVGSGDATLTINGAPVPVAPNGAFLAFLPVPPATAPRYELVATRGAESVRRTVAVRVPRRVVLGAGGPLADEASVAPTGRLLRRADEPVRVSVRAVRDAQLWLETPRPAAADSAGTRAASAAPARVPLVDVGAPASAPTGEATTWAVEVPAQALAGEPRGRIVVARGGDTTRLAVARVDVTGAARSFVRLGRPGAVPDTDRVIVGRPVPEGTYKWLLVPGTVVERTGAENGWTRVRLDAQLEVWVDSADAVALPDGYAPARRVVGNPRVTPAAEWVDVVFPMASPAPFQVYERGRDVELVLYSTQLSPDILPIAGNDTLVRQLVWEPEATDRVRVTLRLSRDPYGYLALWDPARGFVLRLRRAPAVNAAQPLRGLTIAVDAGHPPGGATGPTGLWEPVAVLPVAERVRDLLRERGATVVMTRTTAEPVGLAERGVMARRANAHAFVSIHLNALPDGINPFTANGTSTLFFHQHSERLARLVQAEMTRRFGVRDLGVHYQNLAVARPSWYPAVLTEGLFLMVPEQEAAMRSPEGREKYARAIVEGLESYFRTLSSGR